jgi:hypothetical protein
VDGVNVGPVCSQYSGKDFKSLFHGNMKGKHYTEDLEVVIYNML